MNRALFSLAALVLLLAPSVFAQEKQSEFWDARNITIDASANGKKIRIGVWDSGVDTSLFEGRLALGKDGKPIIRGYDPFKLRKDTAMALLPGVVRWPTRRSQWLDDRRY